MAYIRIQGALFQEGPQGLQAVSDPSVIRGVNAGTIPVEERASLGAAKVAPKLENLVPGQTPTTQSPTALPQVASTGSKLDQFRLALLEATSLAKQKRNRLALDTVGQAFPAGTLRASDFGGVLQNLNAASTSTLDSIMDAIPGQDDEILSVSDARSLGVPYGTTQSEAATMGIVPAYRSDEDGDTVSVDGSTPSENVPTWDEYLAAAQEEARMNFAPQAVEELRAQYDEAYGQQAQYKPGTKLQKFTSSEQKKLEQAGLLNASRKEQLDYLYGGKGGFDFDDY